MSVRAEPAMSVREVRATLWKQSLAETRPADEAIDARGSAHELRRCGALT